MNKKLLVLVATTLMLGACGGQLDQSKSEGPAKTSDTSIVDVVAGEYKFAYEFKNGNEAYQQTYVQDWANMDESGIYPKLSNEVLGSLKHEGLTTLKLDGNNYTLTKSLKAAASSINIEFEFKGTATVNGSEVKLAVPESATALEEIGGGMASHGVEGNYPTKTSSAADPRILDFFNTPYINYVKNGKAEQTVTAENGVLTYAASVAPQPGPGPVGPTDVTTIATEEATLGEHNFKLDFFSDGKFKVTMDGNDAPIVIGSWSVNAETHSITIENGTFAMDPETHAASVTFDLNGNALAFTLSMETLMALNQNGGSSEQPGPGPSIEVTTIASEQAELGGHTFKLDFFSDGKFKVTMDGNDAPIVIGSWSVNAETHSITIENGTFAMDPETHASTVTFDLNGNSLVFNLSMETLMALNQNGGAQQSQGGEVEAVVVSAPFTGEMGPDVGKTYNLSIKKDKSYAVSCEGTDRATGTWTMNESHELVFNETVMMGDPVSYTSVSNADYSKTVTMKIWNADIAFQIPVSDLQTLAGYLAA